MAATHSIPKSVALSIVLGGVALFFALPELATTKGRYETAPVLFPYAFLALHLLPSGEVLLPAMLVQFPIYGLFWGWARAKHREYWAAGWLLMTHLVLGWAAALLCKIDYHVSRGHYPF